MIRTDGSSEICQRHKPLEPDPVNTGVGMGYNHSRLMRHPGVPPGPFERFSKETKMKYSNSMLPLLGVAAGLLCSPALYAQQSNNSSPLTEVVVTAELLDKSALRLPNSVTTLTAESIGERTARHLEDLLNLTPNVNYATGASRGRFIQIRGIGERSEFQEPIINSVGLLVDGIDFTGIGSAAGLLDVQQVEILRGPQGTLHGANALAGLINVVSHAATDAPYAKVFSALEELGGFDVGGVLSGPLSDASGYRFAARQYRSDGYTDNVFLGREDTARIKETAAKFRLESELSDVFDAQLTVLGVDVDNGYDAFSLDNTRQTYSDQPGVDTQQTLAVALDLGYQMSDALSVELLASHADSELVYSYDEDWSHAGICEGTPCDSDLFGFDWFYVSFDQYQRDNRNSSLDLRLVNADHSVNSMSWVLGAYFRDQRIDLLREYTFAEGEFASLLDTENSALYGQVEMPLAEQWTLAAGLRLERRKQNYDDNAGAQIATSESLWGGRVSLQYQASDNHFYYGLISRGYKAGGFNLDAELSNAEREFDTETMINYELGIKATSQDQRLRTQLAFFYQDREDVQSKQSIVRSIASGDVGGLCPCSFTDFTDNATSGSNWGVELELLWAATSALDFSLALGLLETEFDEFLTFDHVAADREAGVPFNLRGREQAHAPGYQLALGAKWRFAENWSFSGMLEAKDDFYFSDRHEERSDAYELINLQLAYQADNWQLALYAKNVTDEVVKTRGFGSFGNDPRKFYVTEPYNQFAAPRIVGVKAELEFE